MKKVLIIVALIAANQAFAHTPSKPATKETVKTVLTSPKTTLSKKVTTKKIDWYMGAASVSVTTDNTGCNGSGGGSWGWFWGWFRH